jgi:hypothetical protein
MNGAQKKEKKRKKTARHLHRGVQNPIPFRLLCTPSLRSSLRSIRVLFTILSFITPEFIPKSAIHEHDFGIKMRFTHSSFVGLAAAVAMAQQNHAVVNEFDYTGCVSIDCSALGIVPVQPDGVLTPESCQEACAGHLYAAVFWE